MGDIADMILDGTLCQVCGEVIDPESDPIGYLVTCIACKIELREEARRKDG